MFNLHCKWSRPGLSISGEAVISHNTWIHQIIRPAVRPLARTPVTPNHLTTLRLASGLGAAALLAAPAPVWQGAGIALLVLSLLLDRADGELARLSGRMSRSGHRYDLLADGFSNGAVFVGIGVGHVEGSLGALAVTLGIAAGVAAVVAELLVLRLDSNGMVRTSEIRGVWGFDPDDAMFLVPLALAFGWGDAVLVAAAVAAPMIVVLLLALSWRPRAAEGVRRGSDIG